MARVLFSNPPWWGKRTGSMHMAGVRAGSRWPFMQPTRGWPGRPEARSYTPYPMFLGFAATWAKRSGAEVVFRDSIATRESYGDFYDHVREGHYSHVVIESATPSWDHDAEVISAIKRIAPDSKIIVTGTIGATRAEEILHAHAVHAVCRGEYEKGVVKVIEGSSGVIDFNLLTSAEMNAQPAPYMDALHAPLYFDSNPRGQQWPHLQAWSSRGCWAKCLAGDTPVNTVEGMISIRELAERGGPVGVFTYSPKEKRAFVTTGIHARLTGIKKKLVRVHFDDGTRIDCTPDHRFLAFKWGNQFVGEKEWECEAKDLTAGMHLRAIKETEARGYRYMHWTRYGQNSRHRMVAEWMLGRPLFEGEQVHHKDHDPSNNRPSNLKVVAGQAEHFDHHPEISERMRTDNPTKNGMGPEWRKRISKANRGKVRSPESRERYRQAALKREAAKTAEERSAQALRSVATQLARGDVLGRKNTNRQENGQFGKIVNHRVVSVEELPGLHDTYCMEVPETHWFYANNVLVHNCIFCSWPATMTGNDPDGTHVRSVRHYSPEWLMAWLEPAIRDFGFKAIYFDDDTFNAGNKHVLGVCSVMRRLQVPWSAMCRADSVSREVWKEMKASGCFGVKIGYESGSQDVLDRIVRKNLNLEKARETTHFLRSIGLTVHGTFSFGFPGETEGQRQETLSYRESLNLDTYQESGMATLEGTPAATLLQVGTLKAYPGAHRTADFIEDSDGVRKLAAMRA